MPKLRRGTRNRACALGEIRRSMARHSESPRHQSGASRWRESRSLALAPARQRMRYGGPAPLERFAAPERRSTFPNLALGEAEGKFSASQALEIPRNAEGISDSALLERLAAPERRPIPPDPARGENRGISVAGFAPREADGKRSCREMAPQPLEKIEPAPGNGMGSEASNLQDVVHGCAADHPRLRISGVQSRLVSQEGGAVGSYEGKLFRLASP